MEQPINYKHKISSNNTPLIQPTQITVNSKYKKRKCIECNKRKKTLDENHQICHVCYRIKKLYKYGPSGNKVIDDFVRYTQINLVNKKGEMEFVPYEQFINIEFIAEGGFSKIYKANWKDGPIESYSNKNIVRIVNYKVVLKKINDSKNITSKKLNELKIYYDLSSKLKVKNGYYVSKYFGITQDPNSKDIMFIMPYYNSGDLIRYITKDFYNISWKTKLLKLRNIANGIVQIHNVNIVHRDFHSGNIFLNEYANYDSFTNNVTIGDLGISKSATESGDDNENYDKRPTATIIRERIDEISIKEIENRRNNNPTEVIKSSNIGPVIINNPGAIYKSRPISGMINSAMSLWCSRSQSINLEKVKRRFEDDLVEDINNDGQNTKRKKLYENKDYITKENELDIDTNFNNEYITEEIEFDINI
ncbi:uncharacterized protein OCT59_021221 [Rhizophagus irregularis]|nr:hypothetical protein OCT59_021221 [Rhizophagus irregularis]